MRLVAVVLSVVLTSASTDEHAMAMLRDGSLPLMRMWQANPTLR